ncbi:hypothetical protein [Actinoplanes sp. NPDC026619]|uniref:hypothetical protein n=1 Tax=Actinoplanes sp. NPDC026619 TaxID=3155798 RepID=UPI0033CA1FE9
MRGLARLCKYKAGSVKAGRHQPLTDQAGLGEAEQHALRRGRMVRRGQGFSLHVTALLEGHQALLAAAGIPGAEGASSADRKAYRIYHDRLRLAVQLGALPVDSRPGPPDLTKYDALLTRTGR